MDGFDLNSPLVCEGIIGDGCGGGRIFFVKQSTLFVHDPITQVDTLLLKNLQKTQKISKSKCIITIECESKTLQFDLSKMEQV